MRAALHELVAVPLVYVGLVLVVFGYARLLLCLFPWLVNDQLPAGASPDAARRTGRPDAAARCVTCQPGSAVDRSLRDHPRIGAASVLKCECPTYQRSGTHRRQGADPSRDNWHAN